MSKKRIALADICRLPNMQLHSKTAFFKALVGKESSEIIQMRESIAKMSYTVKTIGVQGDEVGITSKRCPLKLKEQTNPKKVSVFGGKTGSVSSSKFLPHKSFFTQPLSTVKKQREERLDRVESLFELKPNASSQSGESRPILLAFRSRIKSMSHLKKAHRIENIQELGRVPRSAVDTHSNKRSYDSLLRECGSGRDRQKVMSPLRHEENPFYKKLKKIQERLDMIEKVKEDECSFYRTPR